MKTLDPDWPVLESKGDDDYPLEVILDVLMRDEKIIDNQGREFTYVGKFLEDTDFYQGLNMITIIRRHSDGVLFGYSWWDDISKHGESYVDANGDQFGLECDTDADDFDWDTDYVSYYVWEPVEEYTIESYRTVSA